MKKLVVALGMAALLLVTPLSSFASATVQDHPIQVQTVITNSDQVYISSVLGNSYNSSAEIPSTYTYSTVIDNKIYRGVLDRNAGGSYYFDGNKYRGFYSGYIYFTGLYAS